MYTYVRVDMRLSVGACMHGVLVYGVQVFVSYVHCRVRA